MINFDLHSFINKNITGRSSSFFETDIVDNTSILREEIERSNILVIGGGGTIGSNYIKSILPFRPAKLVVVDTNENGLTELVRSVRSTPGLFVPKDFITYPVNLADPVFEKIYNYYKPFHIIANFAAHKHVRSEKDVFSIEAMIGNNLFNAARLLKMIEVDQPNHFFCVSTDKAANPVNIMGATKKLMEELVIDYSAHLTCTTARFANVAFSNGSLLDGFLYRIMQRQPLAVPADIKRYFVSPAESGDICMLASVLGTSGDIFFPKLNEDQLTSFYDITIEFLHQLGYEMEICHSEEEAKEKTEEIDTTKKFPVFVFNSDTTGEKLYEEFYTDNEEVDWNRYEALAVAKGRNVNGANQSAEVITELHELFKKDVIHKVDVVAILNKHITNFGHIEKGITLDTKM
ncbi:MAG: nucleoside-diphosphate sugar epimerase [Segetibacter sp.]|nr:nucleoside-diphosphate sugar epimerase [Segetibacter sp.]